MTSAASESPVLDASESPASESPALDAVGTAARGVPFDLAHATRLPAKPGVYLFHGAEDECRGARVGPRTQPPSRTRRRRHELLYVGKAKSLRARVLSYLGKGRDPSIKTQELVRRTKRVETLVTGSEAEALILEANLIKERRPRFNIQLRDDKKYPYIKVTVQERFPRAWVTRTVREDGSRYFGPFVSVGRVRQALDAVTRLHFVRSCRYDLPSEAPPRPCLDHHIGRCRAPCVGQQSEVEYREMIDRIVQVLSGDVASVQAMVEEEMRKAAADMEFERAAHLRNVLAGLDGIARQQRVQRLGGGDQDVLGLARDGAAAAAVLLRVRNGVLVGRETHLTTGADGESDEALVARFASHAYLSSGVAALVQLPREVLLPVGFPDQALLEAVLTEKAHRKVVVRVPRRGAGVRVLELAVTNARHALADQVRRGEALAPRTDEVLYELQDRLGLKVVPRLIVCFDVSHTQGAEMVAAAALFENGEPRKSGYRHMRVQGGWGNDDCRSIAEAVGRYFARLAEGDGPLPDLAVIDGGRGQLAAAREALAQLGLEGVAVAALAKREERVYLPGVAEGLRIPRTARSLHLLQRVRDEAHRFALGYNRKLRSRRTIRSELGEVPGVGPKRQHALLSRFGSVRAVREASAEEIGRVPGFSEAMGVRILTWLKRG